MANISVEDIKAVVAYIGENAEELVPVVSSFLDSLGCFEGEFLRVLHNCTDALVDTKARAIKRFIDEHGFTKEEAILIALRMESDLVKTGRSITNKE